MRLDLGDYEVLSSVQTEECSLRLLRLDIGHHVDAHHHHETTQTYFVIDGVVEATIGGRPRILRPHDVFRIPAGSVHSLRAVEPATVLSISIPPLKVDDQHHLG